MYKLLSPSAVDAAQLGSSWGRLMTRHNCNRETLVSKKRTAGDATAHQVPFLYVCLPADRVLGVTFVRTSRAWGFDEAHARLSSSSKRL